MRYFLRAYLLRSVIALAFALAGLVTADARSVALVIGNADYKVGPLANPVRDAEAVAEVLQQQLKFDRVFLKRNLTREGFLAALREVGSEATGADLGLIYFAGHGIEVGGRNYLIPVDAQLKRARDVELEAVALDVVKDQLDGVSKLKLVILDACRNNPFAAAGAKRSVERGLIRVEPDAGTIVVYAAKDGTTAEDGIGLHSPFTAALLKRIVLPGIDVRRVFGYVSADVKAATNSAQVPYLYGQIGGDEVYLYPTSVGPPSPEVKPRPSEADADRRRAEAEERAKAFAEAKSLAEREARAKAETEMKQQVELEYWRSIRDTRALGQLRDYLQRYPDGMFASIARRWLEEGEAPPPKYVPPLRSFELAPPPPPPPPGADFRGTLIETLASGHWATGSRSNCGVARKTYSLSVDGQNIVWRDGTGNVDIETVTSSDPSSFRSRTVRSIHVNGANVPVGKSWDYLLVGPGQVQVRPHGRSTFDLFKC